MAQKIFNSYSLDSIYYHLKFVFEYLRLEYYTHHKVYRKAEKCYEDVNENAAALLSNYSLFTYTPQFLLTKLERSIRLGTAETLYDENEAIFADFEYDTNDTSKYVNYVVYRALSCYYSDKYQESAKWLNTMINDISLKNYPYAFLEIKAILALQYCLLKDYDLFNQLLNSIQRQVRILGKDSCEHILHFIKILKIAVSDAKKDKVNKIKALAAKIPHTPQKLFTPTKFIRIDSKLINALCN
jgi:tetratricopeptide (TPR) repeat protein